MSLNKQEVKPSEYLTTGSKSPSKGSTKRVALKVADELSTISLMWLIASRHKVGILAVGNIILVLNWVFPEWTVFVKSII